MSYQVIARKWRPQTFEEVTGQEAITHTLRNAVEHERLHHAYLFSGARGVGKTTTARLLAKALNCQKTQKPNPTPCTPNDADACDSCREIAEGRSIDVMEFDAASNTQVDKIRDLIIENINISPARDRYKIFIIDEVHMLSTSSFNALLKTLEEPPPNVVFIMATTELHKVPDTILSRTQEFEFRTIPVAKIFDRLKFIAVEEKVNISDEGLREIARSGEGSMRDAQSNFDQVISFSGEHIETEDVIKALGLASSETLIKTIQAIADKQPKVILETVDDLISRGHDLRNFCRDVQNFLRDLLVAKIAGDSENLLESATISFEELEKFSAHFTESDLIRFFNSLSETSEKLRLATQERYILEIGLIKLIEMQRIVSLEKIIERLSKLESALAGNNIVEQMAHQPAGLSPVSEAANNPQQNSANDLPAAEKKNLKVDFSKEEIPFDVGETNSVVFSSPLDVEKQPEAIISEEKSEPQTSENPPIEDFTQAETIFVSNHTQFSKFQPLDEDFVNSIPLKLPPITSEELEHIEDNWLDNAYETKLLQSGDNLFPITNAEEIVLKVLGANQSAENNRFFSAASSIGSSAAATAKVQDFSAFIPEFEEEKDLSSMPLPKLSDNPTEEELINYAENHPVVKNALRIFRGKIIKVEKTNKFSQL